MKNQILLLLLCISSTLHAQNRGSLKGVVRSSDGEPASYVHISLKNTTKGTTTDSKGEYYIKSIEPGTYILVTTFIGLEAKETSVEVKSAKVTAVPDIILKESAVQLQEVVVNAVKDNEYKIDQPSSSLRIQTPLLETPQSIVVISKDVIEDQRLLVMTDIAKNVSGVTTVYPDAGVHTDFAIRGTRAIANRLRNGMSMGAWITLQEDMSYVENVEFIKGPAGFMLAQGEPGGMFNVVTKKPLDKNHFSANITTGSYSLIRTSVDLGGPLGKGQKVFYRLNTMAQKSGNHLDHGKNDRFSLAPVLRYDFSEKTSITVEYNLDLVELKSTLPLMPTVNHKPLPRDFMIDDPGIDPSKYRNHYGLLNLQHRMNDSWKLTAQAGVLRYKEDNFQLFDWGTVDEEGNLNRYFRYGESRDKVVNGQVFANGDVNTGSVNHKLLIGFDGGRYENTYSSFSFDEPVWPINVYDPSYGLENAVDTVFDRSLMIEYPLWIAGWIAASAMDNIQLLDWLQVALGGRYTLYRDGDGEEFTTDRAFTPRGGVLIQPFENTSFYVMYDQSFIAQAGFSFSGEKFKPLTGNNIEFGIKREWFGKRLLTQAALYNITKNNALTSDPQNPDFSIQRGQIVSKGFEFDATGSVNKNLNIVANYAYTNAKVTKDTDPDVQGTREAAPAHVINTWLKYSFSSGTLNGAGLAFGVSHHRERYMFTEKASSSDKQVNLPDLTNLSGALYYNTGKLSFALNVDNLLNAYNYIGYFDYNLGDAGEYRIMSLPGRNFRLSATIKL